MHHAAELVRYGHVRAERNVIEQFKQIRCAALDHIWAGQEQVGDGRQARFVNQGVIALALGKDAQHEARMLGAPCFSISRRMVTGALVCPGKG